MLERMGEASPSLKARTAGAFYLVILIAATFAEFFVRGPMIVYRDPTITVVNILVHEPLYRLGGAAFLITVVCEPVVALIFYELFKPVNKSLALLAAAFRLVYAAMNGANQVLYFVPLVLLKGGDVSAFTGAEVQVLVMAALRVYEQGLWITLIFFGIDCALIGYLIVKAAFLPRVLGVLMAAAGVCYVVHSFTRLISPPLGAQLFLYVVATGFIAEGLLTLWLLVFGVNAQRWREQAARASAS
jgi:hypothetical protein